ncbi:Leucine-rich repeat and IQ domain-containing protein 3 [Trichoplax sp. H2]|nr:Leucine-rich repeat and IQ domain-containing protein 3 [Trichoplax sp. H2]|eukprot:RDD38681.1 Leucine-rich repeat and IQ domain-containing protein 3 [Trichoplax sp. H2]
MNYFTRKANIIGDDEFRHYAKHREEGSIRDAETIGYINTPNEEFLLKNTIDGLKLDQAQYFNLRNRRLIEIGSLYLCDNLTVCILANNFIRTFDALIYCNNLQMLDVHGNQIVNVPSVAFWSTLSKLSVMLLHDNGISSMSCVRKIANSPNLAILTLHNTPISLKPHYRHHVVNSIFTLKVLDNYVIADEEIIEGCKFTDQFSTKNQFLYLKTERNFDQITNGDEAIKEINLLLSRANKIMAKNSPILIIQRYLRGYLARKILKAYINHKDTSINIEDIMNQHLSLIADANSSQQVSTNVERQIQKSQSEKRNKNKRYLDKTYSTVKHGSMRMGKIKTKNVLKKSQSKKSLGTVSDNYYATAESPILIRQFSPALSTRDNQIVHLDDPNFNYDQDFNNRDERFHGHEDYSLPPIHDGHGIINSMNSKQSEAISPLKINVDLRELQARAAQFTEEERSSASKQFRLSSRELSAIKTGKELLSGLERTMKKEKVDKSDKERYYSPLSDYRMSVPEESRPPISKNSKFRNYNETNENDELFTTHFRLSGMKAATTAVDPVEEMILNKQETAKDMREAKAIYREIIQEKRKPPVVEKHITLNGQQRLYKKLYEAMNLSILRSVDQVHKDWHKSEKAIQKIDTIANRRLLHDVQKERIRQFQRYKVMIAREGGIQDKIISSDALKMMEEERERENLRVQFARQELNEKTKQRFEEMALSTDFNCQATAIGRVIRQYDGKKHRTEMKDKKAEGVKVSQEKAIEKREMVNKYLEHKRMVQRAVNQVEKKKINGKLLEEANDRVMQARARVTYLKQRHRVASNFCKLQNTLLTSEQPPNAVSNMSIAIDDRS